MKKYLLDTNIYIDAYDRYYRNEYFPAFWEKFESILNEHVVIPRVVKEEVTKSDWFQEWLKDNYKDDVLNHRNYAEQWRTILDFVKSSGLYKDEALTKQTTGWANDPIADPWIIAIAKEENLVVVSNEIKIPNLGQGNPVKRATVPDICSRQGIRCIERNDFFGEVGLSI